MSSRRRDERFATNKHAVDSLANKTASRSYAYAALSERPVLLEGYFDHTRKTVPGFKTLLRDNDLIFTTTDPKRCATSPRHGTFDGLSPVPALTSPCPGHCPHGWLSSKTAATLGSTGSNSPLPVRSFSLSTSSEPVVSARSYSAPVGRRQHRFAEHGFYARRRSGHSAMCLVVAFYLPTAESRRGHFAVAYRISNMRLLGVPGGIWLISPGRR